MTKQNNTNEYPSVLPHIISQYIGMDQLKKTTKFWYRRLR